MPTPDGPADLRHRIEQIEAAYEFMLAYAAQGLSGDEAGGTGAQLREHLERCRQALTHLPVLLREQVTAQALEPAASSDAFLGIVEQDARHVQTALDLVLSRSTISSQLIDNLNAWMPLRALLTDLFVLDELLR